VLGDPALSAQCASVGVSVSLGACHLDFVAEGENRGPLELPPTLTRSLFTTAAYDYPSGSYTMKHFFPNAPALRPLFSLIQSKAARPARAGNARATHKRALRHA
jgi:hypothetical protein